MDYNDKPEWGDELAKRDADGNYYISAIDPETGDELVDPETGEVLLVKVRCD